MLRLQTQSTPETADMTGMCRPITYRMYDFEREVSPLFLEGVHSSTTGRVSKGNRPLFSLQGRGPHSLARTPLLPASVSMTWRGKYIDVQMECPLDI